MKLILNWIMYSFLFCVDLHLENTQKQVELRTNIWCIIPASGSRLDLISKMLRIKKVEINLQQMKSSFSRRIHIFDNRLFFFFLTSYSFFLLIIFVKREVSRKNVERIAKIEIRRLMLRILQIIEFFFIETFFCDREG